MCECVCIVCIFVELTGIQNGANQWTLLADAILSGFANCTHFVCCCNL